MEQTVTAKLRLYPEDVNLFSETARAYVAACNYASTVVYENNITSAYRLRDLIYHTLRDEYLLKSQMADSVCRSVVANYKTMFSQNLWHRAQYKSMTYDLVRGRDYTMNLESHQISVNTLKGRISNIRFSSAGFDQYLSKGRLGTGKLNVTKDGKVFFLVPVTVEIPDVPEDVTTTVGIDRGLRFSMVTYDGKAAKFYSAKKITDKRRKNRVIRSELMHRRTKSARRRLKKIGRRENRWMNDVNHCLSKTLVQSYGAGTQFVLEDLGGIRSCVKQFAKRQRDDLTSWSFGDLAFKIEYKGKMRGQTVKYVDPRFTSQACPQCGYVSSLNRDKHKHLFVCHSCSCRMNDDLAAARNIYNKGIQMS
ncbi:MAG: transposase [Spirochaetales bacterium]|nr:transposase [Candidatus Physcosoma equi]